MGGVVPDDAELVGRLSSAQGWRRVLLAAQLGESTGESGPAALRGLLTVTGPGTSDLRCAALLALAKRCGSAAHEDYVTALASKDAATRDYAILALSAYGRDGVWDDLQRRLTNTLKRPNRRSSSPPSEVLMVIYLCRHAAREPGRLTTLVQTLRHHWAALDPGFDEEDDDGDEHDVGENTEWLQEFWPDVTPDGPPPTAVTTPGVAAMERWVRDQPILTLHDTAPDN